MFKSNKRYRQETIAVISGEAHGIKIIFTGYPMRISDDASATRLEYSPNFNTLLMDAIWSAIGDHVTFSERALQRYITLDVRVPEAPAFQAKVRITAPKSLRQFTGELPDAVIAALKSAHIGR